MSLHRRIWTVLALSLLLLALVLAACGGSTAPQAQKPTPTPSPTPGKGQQLLATMAQKLLSAKTLHGIFDVTITGTAFNGTVNSEIWNQSPNENRTVILQSTLSQFPTGEVTVTDGKHIWQYEPAKKVVYTGSATAANTTVTPIATGTAGTSDVNGQQGQFILNIIQTVFTHSDATLVSSSANVNGKSVYDVHVVPQGQTTGVNFNYDGDVYIDKTTNQPIKVDLTISGFGHVVLNLPMLELNQPIPASTFTFVVPAGVKVLPLQQAETTPGTGSLTLAQAQQQAGYHLLSIPSTQTQYVLSSVNALGAPGSQIFTLSYTTGNTTFTIAEGKSLANLPTSGGQSVSLRGTTGTLTTTNGATTLSWTENGVGISITGNGLGSDQIVSIAKLLS
jgi:outer membrane lipoprotein-sorting protein